MQKGWGKRKYIPVLLLWDYKGLQQMRHCKQTFALWKNIIKKMAMRNVLARGSEQMTNVGPSEVNSNRLLNKMDWTII